MTEKTKAVEKSPKIPVIFPGYDPKTEIPIAAGWLAENQTEVEEPLPTGTRIWTPTGLLRSKVDECKPLREAGHVTAHHVELLRAPFPDYCVERTRGEDTGKGFDTAGVKLAWALDRVHEVLGLGTMEWIDTTKEKHFESRNGTPGTEVSGRVVLEVGFWRESEKREENAPAAEWVKVLSMHGYGAHTGYRSMLGDCLKGFLTGGRKKLLAEALGVGLDTWKGLLDEDNSGGEGNGGQRGSINRRSGGSGDSGGARMMRSRFPGNCHFCEQPIEKGEEIAYHGETKGAYHPACWVAKKKATESGAEVREGGEYNQDNPDSGSDSGPPEGHPAA